MDKIVLGILILIFGYPVLFVILLCGFIWVMAFVEVVLGHIIDVLKGDE